jgi:hypothetical protein
MESLGPPLYIEVPVYIPIQESGMGRHMCGCDIDFASFYDFSIGF